jgi:hypothetical protein
MKTLIHNLVLASILLAAAASPSRGAEAVSQSHLAKIWQDIEKSEYNIRWIEDQHSYKSANRAHNLRATYAADGFTLEPRVYDEQLEKPEITIRLASVKKGPGQGHDLTLHKWQTSEGTAQMDAEEVSIAYINDTSGLRQNFYVKSPPLGHGNLNLTLHIEGQGLTPELDQSEKAINFVDVEKNAVLTYSDLNVWDSLQRKIPARMVQNGPDSFSIIVEDANAVYPIVVDPLTSVGTGWGEHDSYSGSCKFGSVVLGEQTAHSAALIVGAPSFDTASYADAGKVFGYTGTGIPSSANWTKEGDQAGCKFGWSLAFVNFDGNGRGLAVGAPYYDSGGITDIGKVYVFTSDGSGSFNTSAFWSVTPALSGSMHFGWSLAGRTPDGGDLNIDEDDYGDLAVGAPEYSYTYTGNGAVFIYKGALSSPSTSYAWSSFGNANSAQLGYSMAATDIDNDADIDLIVGAPGTVNYGGGSVATGGVYYYIQGATSLSTSTHVVYGQNSGDKFGFSVAAIGDQDQDGYNDVLVGAPLYSNGQSQEGKAYLYPGSSSGLVSSSSWSAESNEAGAQMGYSVGGGDMNGDGAADLIIGLPYKDTSIVSLTDNGQAWVYITDIGNSNTPTLDSIILGLANGDHCGWSVTFGREAENQNGIAVGTPDSTGTNIEGTVAVWIYVEN